MASQICKVFASVSELSSQAWFCLPTSLETFELTPCTSLSKSLVVCSICRLGWLELRCKVPCSSPSQAWDFSRDRAPSQMPFWVPVDLLQVTFSNSIIAVLILANFFSTTQPSSRVLSQLHSFLSKVRHTLFELRCAEGRAVSSLLLGFWRETKSSPWCACVWWLALQASEWR